MIQQEEKKQSPLLSCKEVLRSFTKDPASEDGFQLGPLSLDFFPGETVGILGLNGAGKSTLFESLTGHADLDQGRILLNEEVIRPEAFELKKKIGYLPQNFYLPKWSQPDDLLEYAATLYDIPNKTQIIKAQEDYWDYAFFKNKPLAACSHGMQKRVALGLATLHNPELLILDEPFSGLDISHIQALIHHIEERRHSKKLTLLSTHIAQYVARLCSRVFVLTRGKIQEFLPDDWERQNVFQRMEAIEEYFLKA